MWTMATAARRAARGETDRENQTGLPTPLLRRAEGVLDRDLSHVRVFPDSPRPGGLDALALTQDREIHLAPGQFQPDTDAGRRLLGHELTHYAQQMDGRVTATTQAKGQPINDQPSLEREADVVGARIAEAGSAVPVQRARASATPASGAPIQRMSAAEARDAKAEDKLVWVDLDAEGWVRANVIGEPDEALEQVEVALMSGQTRTVGLADIVESRPDAEHEPAVAIPGVGHQGPSKTVTGLSSIHRGVMDIEEDHGKKYVRVYSAVMSEVRQDKIQSFDEATGEGDFDYKDIQQADASGNIVISSGGNTMMWASLGRPLRALKWAEKYYHQRRRDADISQLEQTFQEQTAIAERMEATASKATIDEGKHFREVQRLSRLKKRTDKQNKRMALFERKRSGAALVAATADRQAREARRKSRAAEDSLRDKNNPIVRSFLVPLDFALRLSANAVPEKTSRTQVQYDAFVSKVEPMLDQADRFERLSETWSRSALTFGISADKAQKEINTWSKVKRPTDKQRKRVELNHKKLANAKAQAKRSRKLAREALANRDRVAAQADKEMRSFMPELLTDRVSGRAAFQRIVDFKPHERTFNVDRHYEPNQFGVRGDELTEMRRLALPKSLKSYAYHPGKVTLRGGDVREIGELRDRLGVPRADLSETQWTSGGDFTKQKNFSGQADALSMHYATWIQRQNGGEGKDVSAILTDWQARIPYSVRLKKLDDFFESEGVPRPREKEFMERVVGPWASQNMIAHVMAEDYDRMEKDEDITTRPKPFAQDFDEMRRTLPKRRARMLATGRELDTRIDGGNSPKALLDYLIGQHPELRARFEKISAKSEGYTFYEHAQMVLQQFLRISEGEDDANRLIPKKLIAKMILFHDMEKWNSKSQYGKSVKGEHKLTVDMMRNYQQLWGEDERNVNTAMALVNADPLGDYMKSKKDRNSAADEAFAEIVGVARDLGVPQNRWKRFFEEFHQFYQSDFSSYTDKVSYETMGGDARTGKAVFNRYFESDASGFKRVAGERRLRYSVQDNYEAKFVHLAAMFVDDPTIKGHLSRLKL